MGNLFSIYDAKAKLSQLIRQVMETGETVVICRNGTPVVDLCPHKNKQGSIRPLPDLRGAKYFVDPCEGVSDEDWPLTQR